MRRSTASLLYLLLGVFGGIGFSFYCGYCTGSRIEDFTDPRGYITKDELLQKEVEFNEILIEVLHYGYFASGGEDALNDIFLEDPKFEEAFRKLLEFKGDDTEDFFLIWKKDQR